MSIKPLLTTPSACIKILLRKLCKEARMPEDRSQEQVQVPLPLPFDCAPFGFAQGRRDKPPLEDDNQMGRGLDVGISSVWRFLGVRE